MKKSDEAYKSIGEVAKILNLINKKNGSLNTHTIRFWEKEFKTKLLFMFIDLFDKSSRLNEVESLNTFFTPFIVIP